MGEMRERMLIDVAPITIGAACQLGPRVQLLTADHPLDPELAGSAGRPRWRAALTRRGP